MPIPHLIIVRLVSFVARYDGVQIFGFVELYDYNNRLTPW